MQNKLQTRGLIQIISQLPVNSIIRINNQSIRNDNIFNLIKDYEIKINFSTNMRVCRNARCTFFFVHYYKNRFIFFKLRSFEDFFDLCVSSI